MVGILIILGVTVLVLSQADLEQYGGPPEVFELSVIMYNRMVVSAAAMLIAVFLWFAAVPRNQFPVWLQIVFPLCLPVIYLVLESFGFSMLGFTATGSICFWVISLLMAAVSLLPDIRKRITLRKSGLPGNGR